MTITGDQSLMREINRMALVRAIQRVPGLSRAELAKETGLTKSTVSLLVQDLVDEGWLREADVQTTGAIGRRPTPLFLDGDRLAMIGSEVSVDSISVLTVSLTGEVINETSEPLPGTQPLVVIKRLAQLITSLVEQSRIDGRALLGIGVGVPGAVLDQTWRGQTGSELSLARCRFSGPISHKSWLRLVSLAYASRYRTTMTWPP